MAAANEQIINFPAVAGLDAYTDPNNLKPPALLQADNFTVVNLGELRTRRGFELVEGVSGEPATAFNGDTVPNVSVEAVGEYANADGDRTLLAAGSKLYEFVGSDATHGWRTVNRLPEFVGTLHSVSATGGSVIEVDALPSNDNTLMLTVWITGARTGQELSSDLAYQNKTVSPLNEGGNIVYYAVQEVSNGSFVVPPTVLFANTSNPIYNLRVTKVYTGSSKYLAVIAVQNGATVMYKTLDFGTVAVTGPHTLGTVGQACFRSFDITGLKRTVLGAPGMVVAYCSSDPGSSVTPAQMAVDLVTVDATTGVPTLNATVLDALGKAAPGSGTWFRAWAHRGVVLEQEPDAATVALTARVLTRYYTAPAVATDQLDGQLWTVLLSCASGSLTVSAKNAQIPFIGFQSKDEHANVLSSPIGTTHYSGSVDVRTGLETNSAYNPSPAFPPTPPFAMRTPLTVTATLPDGTLQTYIAQWSTLNKDSPVTGASAPFVMITGLEPNKAGYTPVLMNSIGTPGGFPRIAHSYTQNAPQLITTATEDQVTLIDLSSIAAGLTGFTPGIHTGVPVYNGATVIAYVSVYVDLTGNVLEVALQDGRPGSPLADPNVATPITNIPIPRGGPFVWPAGGMAYTHLKDAATGLLAYDVPNQIDRVTPTGYVQDGATEHCVHRWDVTQLGGICYIGLSSVSASLMTTPNGDSPYGAASPHAQNNMFEVYRWDTGTDRLLVNITGSASPGVMTAALGGPWRMVSGFRRDAVSNSLMCVICPGGDTMQRSSFLVRVDATTSFGVTFAALSKTDPGSGTYVYEQNPGVFVESCNLMRVTSTPMNMPALHGSMRGFVAGALRDGSSRGTQEVFVLEYEGSPTNWRTTTALSDYLFINGGVPTMFDGVTANEVAPLMWPQRDLTSVHWPIANPQIYIVTEQGTQPNLPPEQYACAFYDRNRGQGVAAYGLNTITRPFFAYEAGLKDKNGYGRIDGCGWSSIKTYWGGNPAENYETVYADPRTGQFAFNKASYANGWSEAAEQKQHYYGRFQATPRDYGGSNELFQLGNSAWLLWAPRSDRGWGDTSQDAYKPAEAGGDFLIRWTYEYTDGTGRMVRSAPSSAVQYTVCAEILGAYYNHADPNNTVPFTGGTVTEFRWGFFAPRMELTNRLKTAALDSQRVSLQPYTTAEPYSTVLYRMPLSSWQSPSSAFVIGRNQTRGVVAFSLDAYAANQPLGYVINNFSLFDGPQKDYNGLLSEPFLYTTGSVLDNVAPPSCKAMCVHQNRLVIGGADDPTVIWFTKELTAVDAPGFNDALTFTMEDGGAVTGLASLESALVVFKSQDIFVISGTMPDATGYGPSLATPIKLPHGVGCRDHRSVIETPVGIFFQSDRTIELLTPSLELKPVGLQFNGLDGFDVRTVTSASHNPERQEVYFTYYLTSDPNRSSQVAVFNYGINGWMRWTLNALGVGSQLMATIGGQNQVVCAGSNIAGAPQALLYRESSIYADKVKNNAYSFITNTLLTASFAMHEVQGYERAKRASVLLNPASGAYPAIQIQVRGPAQSPSQLATWTSAEIGSLMTSANWSGQLEVHVAEQKNRGVVLGITTSGTGAANNIPLRIAGFAFRIGLKTGFNKRTTETARH